MTEIDTHRRNLLLLGTAGLATFSLASTASAQAPPSVSDRKPTPLTKVEADVPKGQPKISAFVDQGKDFQFSRTKEDLLAWQSLQVSAKNILQITNSGSISSNLSPAFRRIESDFVFAGHPEDTDFSSLHIEPLLDQAADLLDRAVRDRAAWDDLAAKWLLLALEIGEYSELDKIHQDEEADGYYDHTARSSNADRNAENINGFGQSQNESISSTIYNNYFNYSKINELFSADQTAAWMNGLVPYTWDGQIFTGYVSHTIDGDTQTISGHTHKSTTIRQEHSLLVQQLSWLSQYTAYANASQISVARVVGLDAQADWDASNAIFQRRRTVVSRNYEDMKSKAALAPDGLLNYSKRLDSLKMRFQNDFRDALARLRAAADGLLAVYNYGAPLPVDSASLDYFDDCLLWNRRAIQWLIRFSRQDQSVILPLSTREFLTEEAWERLVDGQAVEFDLPDAVFEGMSHVRLRGMGASIVSSEAAPRLWTVDIEIPRKGKVTRLDGTQSEIDQTSVPGCKLARATTRLDKRDVDIVGVSALHNASPIGRWRVTVRRCTPALTNFSGYLDDITIDVHLSYRQARSK